MEYLSTIIETTINSFDFTFCLLVNILTYIIIKLADELNGEKVLTIWNKRIILFISITIISLIWYFTQKEIQLIFNSAILAPVSWSWVFKPICKYLKIDYKNIDSVM